MVSTWTWVFLNLLIYTTASSDNGSTKAFIELIQLDYEDACYDTAQTEWSFINSPSNETLCMWEKKLISYAKFKKAHRGEVGNISVEICNNPIFKHKCDVIGKPGNELLNDEDFKTMVHFIGTVESAKVSALCMENSRNYTRKEVEHDLSLSKTKNKSSLWAACHQSLLPHVTNFSQSLLLIHNAAQANDAKDVTEYWELLTGYVNGYEKMNYEWNRIVSLYNKVWSFGMNSLSHKYEITMNKTMPAYLLGSLQGNDWTVISADMTPYPDLVYNIRKNLWKRRLIGMSLYKTASAMGATLLNQVPQADFWEKSQFNQECPSTLINFCREGITRVSTCFEPTVSNFISAHKDIGKILFNQLSVETTPILNIANRYSGLEEGISELFGVLSASPAWLNHTQLTDNSTDNDKQLIVSLMITALNVLPRLAYYMSADMWRINVIKNKTKSTGLISSWWKYRQEYEGISSEEAEVPTFLNDDLIIKNKPYLPKFIGTLLAFQLYEYLMESTEVRYNRIIEKQVNPNFIKMIQQGAADDWVGVLDKFLEIDDITADSLMSFFTPLEKYLDEIDEDFQYKFSGTAEAELEQLKKKVIDEMYAPGTTTTTIKSAIDTSLTKKKLTNVSPPSVQNDTKRGTNAAATSKKSLESKSSIHLQDDKLKNLSTSKSEVSTKASFDESLIDIQGNEEDKKPKINTSKAVWAVGAVLVATIIICIIAIFGRQRCRKTPKNRRYV